MCVNNVTVYPATSFNSRYKLFPLLLPQLYLVPCNKLLIILSWLKEYPTHTNTTKKGQSFYYYYYYMHKIGSFNFYLIFNMLEFACTKKGCTQKSTCCCKKKKQYSAWSLHDPCAIIFLFSPQSPPLILPTKLMLVL